MKINTNASAKIAQRQCKTRFDKCVRGKLEYGSRNYVFANVFFENTS